MCLLYVSYAIGSNEALVRVRRMPPPTTLPPPVIRRTTTESPRRHEPPIITKGPPRVIFGKSANPNGYHPPLNTSDPEGADNRNIHSYQKTASFYAGEIAVLTLSTVIFLGGLLAAISVACVRRKRRRGPVHHPPAPLQVRLQKQMPTARIAGGSARPVLFPMALPGEPLMGEGTTESESWSETGEGLKDSLALATAGFSLCPDCRKLRKPVRGGGGGGGRETRDRGPMKLLRPREISLQSSHDSGIEGSDGHCNCCHSHNSSSDSGRSVFV
jgi:hypothetical protein